MHVYWTWVGDTAGKITSDNITFYLTPVQDIHAGQSPGKLLQFNFNVVIC